MLAWGLLWYFGISQVIKTLRSFRRRRAVPTEQVLLILCLVISYLAIFIGWRFPGRYHLAVLPPLSLFAGQAFSHFVAEQRRFPRSRWRWIRAGIIGAAALPAIGFLTVAFATRRRILIFSRLFSTSSRKRPRTIVSLSGEVPRSSTVFPAGEWRRVSSAAPIWLAPTPPGLARLKIERRV